MTSKITAPRGTRDLLPEDAPAWELAGTERFEADPTPSVRARYAEVRELTATR